MNEEKSLVEILFLPFCLPVLLFSCQSYDVFVRSLQDLSDLKNDQIMSNISAYIIGAILSLQTLCTCVTTTIGQYIYAFYLNTYPIPPNGTANWTTLSPIPTYDFLRRFTEETKGCTQNDFMPSNDAQAWAQQRSADLFFWTNLCSSCPVILMTYLLGLYTPKLGHRFVLILPMLGTLIQLAIWLSIIYFHLPEFWWYIAAVILGFSGSSSVLSRKTFFEGIEKKMQCCLLQLLF